MKKLRRVLLTVIMLVLSATLIFGGLHLPAHAEEAQASQLFSGQVVRKVKIGTEDIVVPGPNGGATVTVKAPDGRTVYENTVGGKVTPAQVGNYIVTFVNGDNSYSYNVLAYEEKDYFINVIETADGFIPSYARAYYSPSDPGSTLVLPRAELAYKNSKGEIVSERELTSDEIEIVPKSTQIRDISKPANESDNRKELYELSAGLLKIVYKAKLSADANKVYTKEFSVSVQNDFVNENAPTISIASFTRNANLNVLYTLPQATAKDDYDQNPFVEISVIGPDQKPVRVYDVDADGYAIVPTDATGNEVLTGRENVVFDNNNNRGFYPTQDGDYKVSYIAHNGAGLASSAHTFTIEAHDKLAPVIKEIEESQIPVKWGIKKVMMGKDVEGEDDEREEASRPDGTAFRFPMPTVTDNFSKQENMMLTISVVNPNSRTVARWEGKLNNEKDGYFSTGGVPLLSTYSRFFKSIEPAHEVFTDLGVTSLNFKPDMLFSFNFFDFDNNDTLKSKDAERIGDWTITYSLRDAADNGGSGTARKSFTIEVSDEFSDIETPVISESEIDLPKYILLGDGDEDFTVPSMGVTDDKAGARLKIDYVITTNEPTDGGQTFPIDGIKYDIVPEYRVKSASGGQVWPIRFDGFYYYLLIKDGSADYAMRLPETDAKIHLTFTAADNAGNTTEEIVKDIDVITARGIDQALVVDDDINPRMLGDETGEAPLEGGKDKDNKDKVIVLGNFDVTGIDAKYRSYTGFELSILDKDNKALEATVWTYFYPVKGQVPDPDSDVPGATKEDIVGYTLHLRDIMFTPTYASVYRLNVRFYDLSGQSYVYSYSFEVERVGEGSKNQGTAAVIGTEGQIYTPYELKDKYTKYDPLIKNSVLLRKITSSSFALVGYNFIGLVSGSAVIKDYIYDYDTMTAGYQSYGAGYYKNSDEPKVINGKTIPAEKSYEKYYPIAMSDSDKPVIEIQGDMPTYFDKTEKYKDENKYVPAQFIDLPVITAYTPYENAEVTITASFSSSGTPCVTKKLYIDNTLAQNDGKNETDNTRWTFSAKTKGVDNKPLNKYAFSAYEDGDYLVRVYASSSSQNSEKTYTIKVGKTTLPAFEIDDQKTAFTVGDNFRIGKPRITNKDTDEEDKDFSVVVTLKLPSGTPLNSWTFSGETINTTTWFEDQAVREDAVFSDGGTYELVFEVTNKAKLTSKKTYRIQVASKGTSGPANMVPLTIVLIIIGVLLIAGVIVYVVRFRAVKK